MEYPCLQCAETVYVTGFSKISLNVTLKYTIYCDNSKKDYRTFKSISNYFLGGNYKL